MGIILPLNTVNDTTGRGTNIVGDGLYPKNTQPNQIQSTPDNSSQGGQTVCKNGMCMFKKEDEARRKQEIEDKLTLEQIFNDTKWQIASFGQRTTLKWMKQDRDGNGKIDTFEAGLWREHNKDDLNKPLTNPDGSDKFTENEYSEAEKQKITGQGNGNKGDDFITNIDSWAERTVNEQTDRAKGNGVNISEEQKQEFVKTFKEKAYMEANAYLFKDPKDSLYIRGNTQTMSTVNNDGDMQPCCGAIDTGFQMPEMIKNEHGEEGYSQKEMQKRFDALNPQKMSMVESLNFKGYDKIKGNIFEIIPNSKHTRPGCMSETQFKMYQNIVSQVTGVKIENGIAPDVFITKAQQMEILHKFNDYNDDDGKILEGKTKADIDFSNPFHKNWYEYLKTHHLLFKQFE